MEKTKQMNFWSGDFGKEYTDRNPQNLEQLNSLYLDLIGIPRTEINESFIKGLKISSVLEVGANVGVQLIAFHDTLGLKNLYGIEIQDYAVDVSKGLTKGKDIHIIKGSALDLPFKENSFDLVMTNGVLIHISPNDINKALDEIHRCSKKYIFGYEYFAEKYSDINYRGNSGFLWKTNFAKLFLDRFPDLKLVKETKYPYVKDSALCDQVYLLEKTNQQSNKA